MAKRLLILLALISCAFVGTAADASAATKKKRAVAGPSVTRITPMRAQVGEKLTITGKNFVSGKGKTKVYFLREGGGVTWVPSDSGSKTRLIVTVPEKIIPLLRGTAEARQPTRFQIRLLGRRFGTATKLSKSPVFTAPNASPADPGNPGTPGSDTPVDGDCDLDGIKNGVDPDDDNDALTDDLEALPAHTDPCKADTDGDTVADGYEFYSAKDINDKALPYPGKKPWPNPLDSTDAGIDHDQDGLLMTDEYLLWKYYGNLSVPLIYSAGDQHSVEEAAPAQIELAYMDMDRNGRLSDDERDGDGDGLTNWDEAHGRMTQGWWDAMYDGQAPGTKKETRYPLTYPDVSIFDPDSDGDGRKDGEDDQDHDGLSNAFEVARPGNWGATHTTFIDPLPNVDPTLNPWARVQPYNPCKPVWSDVCHKHPPFGYYDLGELFGGQDVEDDGIPGNEVPPTAPWTWPGSDPVLSLP